MNLKRDQLILLGWIGLGLTIDPWIGPMGYIAAWFVARSTRRDDAQPNQMVDAIALMLGSLIGGWLSGKLGSSGQFFLGHGLAAVQFVRIRRRVTARETWSILLITLLQLGVVCATILDIRFLLIFLFAVALAPRALAEINSTDFTKVASQKPISATPSIGFSSYCLIGMCGVLVFALFPRGALGSAWRGPATRGGGQSLLDSMMDPSRSGYSNSRKILMEVEAGDLGYLRCFAFTDYDGEFWTRQRERGLIHVPPANNASGLGKLAKRTVRVKHVNYLNSMLPSDGRVSRLQGNFFRRAFRNPHGLVEVEAPSQRAHNVYEYWTDLVPKPEPISEALRERCLKLPPISDKVKDWSRSIIGSETNLFQQAKLLELHLRSTFTYVLGAPELNRNNALEDFLFQERRGHCERFASALAVLLRLQGVPSRVVGGYAAGGRNWISGWYDVRFSDAHAWTEAWFENRGWVVLDGTPRATMTPPADTIGDIFEAMDFAWYAHVVNLDAPTQNEILANVAAVSGRAFRTIGDQWPILLALCSIPAIFMLARKKGVSFRKREQQDSGLQERRAVELQHAYGQMLVSLERHGIRKTSSQTPREFLERLGREKCPCLEDASLLTDLFCRLRYGGFKIEAAEVESSQLAVARIKAWCTK